MESEKQHILELMLGIVTDEERQSTMQIGLNSARFLCGYTGRPDYSSIDFYNRQGSVERIICKCTAPSNTEEGDLFSSLLLYLACLDQIGAVFCSDVVIGDSNNIVKALTKYAIDLTADEITALKYLRHSFAHNLGLANHKNGNFHKFTISYSDSDRPVVLCKQPWNGDFANKDSDTSTMIYVFPLIRMVEQVVCKCQKDLIERRLSCLEDTEMLKTLYTVVNS
ncbi:MAG: hypothetical protein MJZ56_06030 [Bacteroidales bacterium]|nr:hypothetical protein [Bacteroidales bacterium]